MPELNLGGLILLSHRYMLLIWKKAGCENKHFNKFGPGFPSLFHFTPRSCNWSSMVTGWTGPFFLRVDDIALR